MTNISISYKNYMVMEISEEPVDGLTDWMIACFSDYEIAKFYADAFCPKIDIDRIEIWGTNQDPQDFTSCEIIYTRGEEQLTDSNFNGISKKIDLISKMIGEETDKFLDDVEQYQPPKLEIRFREESVEIPIDYAELNNSIQGFLKDLTEALEEY